MGAAYGGQAFVDAFEPSVGVTVLLEVLNRPKYLSGAQDLVLGHKFLTFALQFTGADVSFPPI
jgi:hypothetical protein